MSDGAQVLIGSAELAELRDDAGFARDVVAAIEAAPEDPVGMLAGIQVALLRLVGRIAVRDASQSSKERP